MNVLDRDQMECSSIKESGIFFALKKIRKVHSTVIKSIGDTWHGGKNKKWDQSRIPFFFNLKQNINFHLLFFIVIVASYKKKEN